MQLNFDRDDFDGDVLVVKDPRGGWGVAMVLKSDHGNRIVKDDGSEVWGTITVFGDARGLLRKAAAALDMAMGEPDGLMAVKGVLEALPPGTLGYVSSPVPPYKEDLIPEAIKGLSNSIAKSRGVKP